MLNEIIHMPEFPTAVAEVGTTVTMAIGKVGAKALLAHYGLKSTKSAILMIQKLWKQGLFRKKSANSLTERERFLSEAGQIRLGNYRPRSKFRKRRYKRKRKYKRKRRYKRRYRRRY